MIGDSMKRVQTSRQLVSDAGVTISEITAASHAQRTGTEQIIQQRSAGPDYATECGARRRSCGRRPVSAGSDRAVRATDWSLQDRLNRFRSITNKRRAKTARKLMDMPSVRLKTLESIIPPKLRPGSNGVRDDRLPEMPSINHATAATGSEFARPDTDHFDGASLPPLARPLTDFQHDSHILRSAAVKHQELCHATRLGFLFGRAKKDFIYVNIVGLIDRKSDHSRK
jgi:hypothetical protein